MKTFYNVVKAIICCAKEMRASIVLDIEWVQFLLQNCEKVQNYRFKWGKKRTNSFRGLYDKKKKNKKTAPHSTVMKKKFV